MIDKSHPHHQAELCNTIGDTKDGRLQRKQTRIHGLLGPQTAKHASCCQKDLCDQLEDHAGGDGPQHAKREVHGKDR